MKHLMTTTALVVAVAAGSAGHAQATDDIFTYEGAEVTDLHASELIGMSVYAVEPIVDGEEWDMAEADIAQVEWDDVGEINDIILTRDGTIASVLVDIGGFLGLGEHQISVDMEDIRFVSDSASDNARDFFLVLPVASSDFDDAPRYEGLQAYDDTAAGQESVAENDTNITTEDQMAEGTALDTAQIAALTADDLTGARVYGVEGEWIGDVSTLILAEDGQISAAIVDVGGFLGLGEKPVALSMDEMQIERIGRAETLRVMVPMTDDQLEELPAWDNG